MQITIENNPNIIVTTHGDPHYDGTRLVWVTTNHWNKLGRLGTDKVFAPLNEYLASLPPPHQSAIFNIYAQAHAVFDQQLSFDENTRALKPIVENLLACLDFDRLAEWTMRYGNIAYNADIREVYTGEHPRPLTYLKDEYNELVVLSLMLKAVVPIWALYLAGYSDSRGKDYRDTSAFELVTDSMIMTLPAMERLREYCEASAERNSKQFAPAICQRLGSDEIPRMFLASAAVRRLAVGDIRNPDKTLIKEVYKYLESTTTGYSKGVRDKRSTKGENDEPESVSERYRISSTIPDMAVEELEADLEHVDWFCTRLERNAIPVDPNRVHELIGRMENNPQFAIADYHLSLAVIPLKDLISIKLIASASRMGVIRAVALAAATYEAQGPTPLCDFLTAGRTARDLETLAGVGGIPIRELTEAHKEQVEALYPYKQTESSGRPRACPGLVLIQNIVEEVNQYSWGDTPVPISLREDIANAIIQYLG